MAFKISARMVLELGAELISSDAIAIYELVKNAIDAGSPRVGISMQVVLRRSKYKELLEELEEPLDDQEEVDVESIRAAIIDAVEDGAPQAARRAFRRSIQHADSDPKELAQALKEAYSELNWIVVQDWGDGMDISALNDNFLTIGTRSRRSEKVGSDGRYREPARTVLGDKGVGRLSAMRLGDKLYVETSKRGQSRQNLLEIDWTRFSHETSDFVEDVTLRPRRGQLKEDPSDHGTTIKITGLKSDWDAATFKRMVDEQFKRIVDPFPNESEEETEDERPDPNDLFELSFNENEQDVPEIPQWLLEAAHAVVEAEYLYDDDGEARLRGNISYTLRNRETYFDLSEAELVSLTDPIADRIIRTGPKALRELGPFSIKFYWYNRRILSEILEVKKRRRDVLAAVNSWAGGLMVFRDGFRINPYGGQDDDWLELDKKALAARAYKVNRSQIIGKVQLTSRNYQLVEQTNREGFVDNEFKQILVGIARHVLITEFRTFIERVDRERKVTDESSIEDVELRIEEANSVIERRLLELSRDLPSKLAEINELRVLTRNLGKMVDQAKQIIREYEDDRSKFVHLAGIGLMVEFILHEIGRASGRALDVLDSVDFQPLGRENSSALKVLRDQLKTLGKRVETLDPLSTSRRQIKETFDLSDLVRQVIDGRADQLRRHEIEVNTSFPRRPFKIKAVKGMVFQIIENLFENAVYWLNVEQRRVRGFHARIEITLDAASNELVFSDNGPGIALHRANEIFEPFVTSKPPGQGRGLGLYISREIAMYHDWKLSLSTEEIGDHGRSSTFLLEMGS